MHPLTVGISIHDDELRREVCACVKTMGVRVLFEEAQPLETLLFKRSKPDLMLVSAVPQAEPIEELAHRLKSISPETTIAAVHGITDADLSLRAMRAGVDEFLVSPVREKLQAAVDRSAFTLASRELARRPSGKVVGFVSAKGGCGATSVACHVARELQRGNAQVLLADFDLEAGLIGFLMHASTQYSILDALKNTYRLDQSYWKGLVSSGGMHLDVIPSPNGLTLSDVWNPKNVRDVFRMIRSIYTWVAADLGRSLNPITLTLLEDLDELVLVATPTILALYQAKRIVQRTVDLGYPRRQIRLVLNRVPKRPGVRTDEVEDALGVPVCGAISEREEIEDAFAAGGLAEPASLPGKQFAALALQLGGAPEEKSRTWLPWFGAPRKPAPSYSGL
jgi:pilus assembly protein CpaE